MSNILDPDPSAGTQGDPRIGIMGPESSGSFPSAVRWTVPARFKDKLEAEEVIRCLTERDHESAFDSLKRLIVWHLAGLAYFALLIVLLYGLGIVTLPTAFLFIVVGPLLSGVLALLGTLVKLLFSKK